MSNINEILWGKERMSVFVVYRLRMIYDVDLIIVLKEGSLVE